MPLITDPSFLTEAQEIKIEPSDFTIEISTTSRLTNLGVTGQALYSFLKEVWKSNDNLIPYPFPMVSITPEQFEFVEGWKPKDTTTRNLIRSAGWREIDDSKVLQKQYMNVISLGSINSANTAYLSFAGDTSLTNFSFGGTVNQAVQVYQEGAGGYDRRSDVLTTFIRTQGQLYGSATTTSIGLTSLNYIANRFPLAEAVDTKIDATDTAIETLAVYTGMSITYAPELGGIKTPFERNIGGNNYNFDVVIDGNQGTAEQIYEFVQYSLRQNTDIDENESGKIGSLSDELLAFLGNDLKTNTGVYVDGFQPDDTNRITFTDNTGTERTFPFVAAGSLNFNQNLVDDPDASFHMFFTDTFGSASATIVNDNDANPITGNVTLNGTGRASIGFDFDFDGNIQQGRTAGTPANVTVVAIGLNTAQHVIATATIGRATGQTISLVAPLERNYSNE